MKAIKLMDSAKQIVGANILRCMKPSSSVVNFSKKALLASTVFSVAVAQAFGANLTDVKFNSSSSGDFEVKMTFDGAPPQPKGYSIEKPARIAIDMPGSKSLLSKKKYPLNFNNANSAVIVNSGDRTRLILNLTEVTPYSTRIEGNHLIVDVGSASSVKYVKPAVVSNNYSRPSRSSSSYAAPSSDIIDLDFNRGDKGEGQLVINMNNINADTNVYVEGSTIKVKMKGVQLPERLQRFYEVGDFATPVKSFDAKNTSSGAVFSVKAQGEYDYLAYQADNKYVLSVKPLTKEEIVERKKEFSFTGEKLSLNFQNIEVRAVLQLIADFTGLNLVASDTVGGNITLRLKDVPWDQALELVLKTKGLDKRQVGNVLMVAPAAEIAERERQEIENNKQIEELAPLQTEYMRIRYADAKELFKLFDGDSEDGGDSDNATQSILSPRGSVIVDERTNSLLVTETAQKLEEFRRVVKLLDVPIRQVLIEARIVIASSNFDEQLGINWGLSTKRNVDGTNVYAGGTNSQVMDAWNTNVDVRGKNSLARANARYDADQAGNKNGVVDGDERIKPIALLNEVFPPSSNNVLLGLGNRTGQFAVGLLRNNFHIGMELSALEAQGKGEIVSQPKVITGDKQPAVIKSGTEVPYEESAANGNTTVSFKEAVLKLEVTPSITPDDRIIMDLVITQDSLGELVQTSRGQIPTIDTTELETQVIVNNGETVVLGGVFNTEEVHAERKVPVLGDLPYVGKLFKQNSVRQNKAETLIFITPKIMADELLE